MGNQGSSRGKIVGLVALGVVVVAVVGFFVVMGKQYFDNRYAGSMYYTQVPVDEPVAVGDLFDMNGNVADEGYSYTLVGYNDEGEEQLLEFDVRTDNPTSCTSRARICRLRLRPPWCLARNPSMSRTSPPPRWSVSGGNEGAAGGLFA